MLHVALITNGIVSTLHASLELSRRLHERGHRVTVLSHVDLAASVEAHGHRFVELRADRDAIAEIRRTRRARRLAALPRTLWRARRRTAEASELADALRRLSPDLLVIDTEAHVAILAGSALDIPTALTTFLFAVGEHSGVPPIDSHLTPGDDEAIAAEWARVRAANRRARRRRRWSRRGLLDLFGPIAYSTTSPVALRAVASRSGFDLARRTDPTQWLRPHTYLDLPTLTTNLRELEFEHQKPPNWHYVGPMVARSRTEVRLEPDDWQRWLGFRDRNRAGGRPLVYCSLGSYWSADADLLSRIMAVFDRRSDWDLVLGLGDRLDPSVLGPGRDNVLALRWAPQVEVLADADVAIVHGGNAGLNECVVAGVPMVVYSTGHLDQNGVAARITYHGVGVAGDAVADESATIEARVESVLGDGTIRARIGELRDLALDPSRMVAAVELLEGLATGSRP